jgi:hypothetical protein
MTRPQWGAHGQLWSGGAINLNVSSYATLQGGGFLPAWTDPVTSGGSGCTTMTTPYGPGFSFTVTDSDVAIWDSTAKDILLQASNTAIGGSDQAGTIVQYTTHLNVPSQTISSSSFVQNGYFAGVLFELHTGANQAHGLSVDTSTSNPHHPSPAWRFDVQYDAGGNNIQPYYGPVITYDTWHRIDGQMYWTTTTNGFQRWYVDGTLVGDYSGQTYWTSFGNPYLQFGFYSGLGDGLTNYSQFGPITRQLFASGMP